MYLETYAVTECSYAFRNDRFLLDYTSSYSLTSKIPTLSYTWGLKRYTFRAEPAPRIGHNPAFFPRGRNANKHIDKGKNWASEHRL